MIFVVDFGSQTAHLIARRIMSLGVKARLVEPEEAYRFSKKEKPDGIILSGGPADVYGKGAPRVDKRLFDLKIPVLGICYGQQLIGHMLPGGKVALGKIREFGPAEIDMTGKTALFEGLPENLKVWMSHGNKVVKLPKGFVATAKTKDVAIAAMSDEKRQIYCIMFHPEVSHTDRGMVVLENFVKLAGLKVAVHGVEVKELVRQLANQMPKGRAICAVSGGIDSTVAAILAAKAIGKRLVPIYVESGLMRKGTRQLVQRLFEKHVGVKVDVVEAKAEFLSALKGVVDPEKKRKVIGELYVKLFEKEAKRFGDAKYLIQGTIYSDVIESKGSKHADVIKSHHNVGGLPKEMGFEVVEPLREFYKDEVRSLALKLKLPREIAFLQPFPGPGQAVRIMGEVTPERLVKQQQADGIVIEEFKRFGWYGKVFQCFPVMTGAKSTAVKGDYRVYAEVVAVRAYESADIMTAGVAQLPYDLLQAVSSRIVNEIRGVSRVVYDVTTKPPATMEWE